MTKMLSEKQLMYIKNSHAKWNLAHGSVRSGKTVCTLFRFMEACYKCPDTQIWMMGRSSETIFDNAIRLILEAPSGDIPDPLGIFRPFCNWSPGKRELRFFDKTISTVGCQNEGAIGAIQGKTFSLAYCDEITLYPESIIDMIDTRLSNPHSMGFASMNPSRPDHKVKQWIDKAIAGDKNYYELHFSLDDNPFVDQEYKDRLKNSLSGVFYKRNYLGLWCMAEGAIFDFFDRQVHVLKRPPRSAEYYIAAIDYGTSNAFCCLIAGVSTGRNEKLGKCIWIEKEYYYDSKKVGRQKTNSEYADDVEAFLDMYPIKTLYLDPSAASFKVELRRRKIAVVDADNDVLAGIETTASEMKKGNLFILDTCVNLIREIEGYVWDDAKIEKGIDAPMKRADHACVTGDTLVLTTEGYTKIKNLTDGELINYNLITKKFEIDTFSNTQLTRKNSEVYEIELENGMKIKATADHKFLTQDGYKELQQLTLSDMLLTNVS